MESRRAAAFSLGVRVFGGLMVLTLFEYWIAAMAEGPIPYPAVFLPLAPVTWLAVSVAASPLPYLAVVAVIKAVMIAYFFMHVAQVWRGEGGH